MADEQGVPRAPTVEDFQRFVAVAHPTLSRDRAELLVGERLSQDYAEYRITSAGRNLRIEYFRESTMTKRFWIIWLPDGTALNVNEPGKGRR